MPDPVKSKRGGARPGAGRKKKGHGDPARLSDLDIRAAAKAATPNEIESMARRNARTLLDKLKDVMLHSDNQSARISAANAILDRGFGKPSADTGVDMLLPLFDQTFVHTAHGEVMEEARRLAPLAIAVLEKIAGNSSSHSARVSAAKSLLDRGLGVSDVARLDEYRKNTKAIGKKESAEAAAATAGQGTEWGNDLDPFIQIH